MNYCHACGKEVPEGRMQGIGFPCPECGSDSVRLLPKEVGKVVVAYEVQGESGSDIFGPFSDENIADEWITAKRTQGWDGHFLVTYLTEPV